MSARPDDSKAPRWRLALAGIVGLAVGVGGTALIDEARAATPVSTSTSPAQAIPLPPDGRRIQREIHAQIDAYMDNGESVSPRQVERAHEQAVDQLVARGPIDLMADVAKSGTTATPALLMAPPPECYRSPKPAFCYKPHTLKRKFKKSKLGRSKDFWFPPKARRKMNRAWSNKVGPKRAAKVQWWDKALAYGFCTTTMDGGLSRQLCRKKGNENARKKWRRVAWTHIECGGLSVIGYKGGKITGGSLKGGVIGAGSGALGCYWSKMVGD